MFCTKCGRALVNGSKFCSVCGSKVEQSVASQPEQQAPEQPQPAKSAPAKKKSAAITKVWIAAAAAVVLIAAVLAVFFGTTSSLQQLAEIEDCDYMGISMEEGGKTAQEIFAGDNTVSQDVWESISSIRLKKSAKDLREEMADQNCVTAFFGGTEGNVVLNVCENGVVQVLNSGNDVFCTGGKGLYKKLMKFMPQETFYVGDTFHGKEFGACKLRLQTASDDDIMSAYLEDANDVSNVVDTLKAIRVELAEDTSSGSDRHISVNLYAPEGDIVYMLSVDSSGYGDLYAEDWSYEVYSPELYNKLLDQIIWHNS